MRHLFRQLRAAYTMCKLNTENLFFEKPILNSPYEYPERHWELDAQGQPKQKIVEIKGYRREDAKEKKSTMEN